MLVRYDPFRELDRVTDHVFGWSRTPQWMPMDAVRSGHDVVLTFDLPGVSLEAIDLTVERNVLTVKAEREWSPAEGDDVLRHERPQGSVTRQVTLGESLDTDRLEARYDAGVLTIRLPVAEQAKPRKVEIQGGTPADAIEAHSN
jgi:HSP20 family protein